VKYKAVIFDLGGTLVTQPSHVEFTDSARKIASAVSAPLEDFVEMWFARFGGFTTGGYQDYQEYIRYVCGQIGHKTEDTLVNYAATIPFEITRRTATVPREGAIELLTHLKSDGCKIGLISDCAVDIPIVWLETLFVPFFDSTIFSCSVGMVKADPAIFSLALDELGLAPGDCLYIADGMRDELANAVKVGLDAVRLHIDAEIDENPMREDWEGPVITSLMEVRELVE